MMDIKLTAGVLRDFFDLAKLDVVKIRKPFDGTSARLLTIVRTRQLEQHQIMRRIYG